MKKILIATNLVTLSLFYFVSCKNQTKVDTPQTSPCCTPTDTYGHTLSQFLNVTRNYKARVWEALHSKYKINKDNNTLDPLLPDPKPKPFEDARAIWFNIDSMKKFICTIEKYRDALRTKVPVSQQKWLDKLGIRLYYAAYNGRTDNYNMRHTVFMLPTFDKLGSPYQVDFDPRYLYTKNIFDLSSPEYKYPRDSTSLILSYFPTPFGLANGMIANDGQLCEPNCPTPNTFDLIDH